MDDERGLIGHPIDDVDGLREGAANVRVRLLVETDVGVADLYE